MGMHGMGRGHMAAFTPAYASRYEVACRALQGAAAEPDGFGADQDALGIEPVEQIIKAPALLADQIVRAWQRRHFEADPDGGR